MNIDKGLDRSEGNTLEKLHCLLAIVNQPPVLLCMICECMKYECISKNVSECVPYIHIPIRTYMYVYVVQSCEPGEPLKN